MAKKRGGLAAFDKDITDARFKTFGTDLVKTQYEQLSSQLETFQQALSAFAATHAKDIRANPAFRTQFGQMCAAIGIDPLASQRSTSSKGSFWNAMAGLQELYHNLAIQVVEICRRSRSQNGGLMRVSDICEKINTHNRKFGGDEVSEDDVVRAVESLKVLESGFKVITIGSNQMVRSVPQELNQDQSVVLEAAQLIGSVSGSTMRLNFNWENARSQQVFEDLLGNGMLWIDTQGREVEYWLPSSIGNI
ncbi:protein of unknown function [Taphrina deformans PYCC 5710]|uniref:Vacuolar-sorting protein SNF8 n=1 Tax=Taphrina deformans (strain PYCC 5710 / ATCC 11124 / CBS 356.35 / IMI 108563 / JCM 9778 / NBRC 8474) TaxID=1097556 RepID=R4XG55_TAPDE|nr:protein of unknown function [Taphrina deformans PYCC 5710]|eukprot:CCG84863.1 protein of unknown function [Taphrina deformans PYCC 5710]